MCRYSVLSAADEGVGGCIVFNFLFFFYKCVWHIDLTDHLIFRVTVTCSSASKWAFSNMFSISCLLLLNNNIFFDFFFASFVVCFSSSQWFKSPSAVTVLVASVENVRGEKCFWKVASDNIILCYISVCSMAQCSVLQWWERPLHTWLDHRLQPFSSTAEMRTWTQKRCTAVSQPLSLAKGWLMIVPIQYVYTLPVLLNWVVVYCLYNCGVSEIDCSSGCH